MVRDLEDGVMLSEMADEEGDEATLEEARAQLKAIKDRAARAELEAPEAVRRSPRHRVVSEEFQQNHVRLPRRVALEDLVQSCRQRLRRTFEILICFI